MIIFTLAIRGTALFKIHSILSKRYAFELTEKENSNHVTLITGINGTGKSSLLAEMIKHFVLQHLRPEGTPVSENQLLITYDQLPSRVVAQTFSPFSKFPGPPRSDFERVALRKKNVDPYFFDSGLEYYLPIGFHKRSGLYSSGIVRKVIEDSLTALTQRHGIKGKPLATALRHLGYKPLVKLKYRPLSTSILKNQSSALFEILTKEIAQKIGSERPIGVGGNYALLRRAVEFSGFEKVRDDLIHAISVLQRSKAINFEKITNINLSLDLENLNDSQMSELRAALLLRRTGFLRLFDLSLELGHLPADDARGHQSYKKKSYGIVDENSADVDVDDLSSGQLQIIGTLFSLATMLENNCLVVIDEPELSLHPKWQLEWLSLLESALQEYTGCHVFVATHSPLITTAAHEAGIQIVSLDPPTEEFGNNGHLSKNASVEETLTQVFETPVPNSSYLSSVLFDAVSLANGSRKNKKNAITKLEKLERVYVNDKAVLRLIKDAKELVNEEPAA